MIDTLEYGYTVPRIMMPARTVNLRKWSVVACDQYTSQPEYWAEVARYVGSAPSTLHLILPEAHLGENDLPERISEMRRAMREYVTQGIVKAQRPGIVLTERHLGPLVRKGILLAMDLEAYDWDIAKHPMIRSSERTVLERIPARVRIRRDAWLELPHIILLIDDPQDAVIGPLHYEREKFKRLYDFELMMDGGRVEGWLVRGDETLENVAGRIGSLRRHDNMLYCVGDGNHSLATAKTIWDEAVQEMSAKERRESPLRYALCEIVNLHDPAIQFEAIHRVFFGVNPIELAEYVTGRLNAAGREARLVYERSGRSRQTVPQVSDPFTVPFNYHDGVGRIIISRPEHPLALGELQPIFDEYVAENPAVRLDYIHGDAAYMELCEGYDTMGFFFAPMRKEEFFDTVVRCGVLPKKTFSIGEPDEKRYYLESRLLKNTEGVL